MARLIDEILGPLAFALLIGGQFLAAIVLTSMRKTLYSSPNEPPHQPVRTGSDGGRRCEGIRNSEIATTRSGKRLPSPGI